MRRVAPLAALLLPLVLAGCTVTMVEAGGPPPRTTLPAFGAAPGTVHDPFLGPTTMTRDRFGRPVLVQRDIFGRPVVARDLFGRPVSRPPNAYDGLSRGQAAALEQGCVERFSDSPRALRRCLNGDVRLAEPAMETGCQTRYSGNPKKLGRCLAAAERRGWPW